MNNKLKLLTLLVTSILFSENVLAAEGEMNFKGKLIEPPNCTINADKPIEVNFGNEVMTSRVDGKMYQKKVAHGLKCTSPELNKMKVQIKGNPAEFDSKSLKTDNTNLAIAITIDKKAASLNEWVNFTYKPGDQELLDIEVTPIKKEGSVLKGGDFAATATMMVDYE